MAKTTQAKDFRVASISRADLENLGFDTSNVDDTMMERVAYELGEQCFEQMFSESLSTVAESLGIGKVSDEDVIDSPLDVAHIEEAVRHNADIGNWGWFSSDNRIESKTSKGVLITVISKSGKVSHRWVRR